MITTYNHVFISYCHDNASEVARLREDLMKAGETIWWDRDIKPGQDWKFAIRQAIKQSYAILLCLSEESQRRTVSGIYPEALDAIAAYREYSPGSIFLIPVRLSDCEIPPVEIDATRTLERLQYVDLFPASSWTDGISLLVEAIKLSPHRP
jgi:TIR domain-containing protein